MSDWRGIMEAAWVIQHSRPHHLWKPQDPLFNEHRVDWPLELKV
jgi:hypothetical protein